MFKMKTSNFYLYIETYNIIMTQFIITTIFTILNFIQKKPKHTTKLSSYKNLHGPQCNTYKGHIYTYNGHIYLTRH